MKYKYLKIIGILAILVILIPGCKKKNRPPYAPYTPIGPTAGVINKKYDFSSLAIDPDGDSVAMRFDWGNGDTSAWTSDWDVWVASEQAFTMLHSWEYPDTYYVRVQAKDEKENISLWSMPLCLVITINHPPNVPIISGPPSGYISLPYTFSSSTTDPDGDNIAIRFDWGDRDTSDWSVFTSSGDSIWMSHSWLYSDTYYVRAQAKDSVGLTSAWSLPYPVILNQLPAPSEPSGPSTGYIQTYYQFSSFEIHPEGSNVAIRFDWDDGDTSGWSTWVSSGSPVTMDHSWLYPDTYNIKAQAKDSLGVTSSWSLPLSIEINNPIRGLVWICATRSAAWSPRESHASVVFHNKIWVAGGHLCTDGVWSSPDGVNWTYETNSAGFGERDDFPMVVYDDKIWVIGGGICHQHPKNDVWCSSDGVNWTCVTNSTQWAPRFEHTAEVFNNKIWVLGGNDGSQLLNDVWYSADGINWTRATRTAEWGIRSDHTSVVFDNRIWVLGGSYQNDVWYSTDGRNWSQATASASWTGRIAHTSVVFDNKIWVLGGIDAVGLENDVWYSTDGREWIREISSTIFPPRWDHTTVVFNNMIWVLGGSPPAWNGSNDVWYRTVIEK